MRYIGNKKNLVDYINNNIVDPQKYLTFIDAFSGTGSVGEYFKLKYKIISCDILYCSFVVSYCKHVLGDIPAFTKLGGIDNVITTLNKLKLTESFIFNEYSENGSANRLYFSENNGKKIDSIIEWIEEKI